MLSLLPPSALDFGLLETRRGGVVAGGEGAAGTAARTVPFHSLQRRKPRRGGAPSFPAGGGQGSSLPRHLDPGPCSRANRRRRAAAAAAAAAAAGPPELAALAARAGDATKRNGGPAAGAFGGRLVLGRRAKKSTPLCVIELGLPKGRAWGEASCQNQRRPRRRPASQRGPASRGARGAAALT